MGIIWLVVEVAHRPEGMSIGCRSRTTPQSRVEAEEGVLGKQKGRRRGKGLKLYTRKTGVEVDDVALRKPRRNKQSPPFSRETSELAAIRGPGRCIGEAKGEGFGAQKRGNVTNSSKDVPGCLVINIGKAIVLKRGHREPRLLS